MITPPIIALCSPYNGNGKTTVADYLVERYGYEKIRFKSTLNSMIHELLECLGVPKEEIVRYMTRDKTEIIPEVGKSYRTMATTLGTEWGRNTINQNLWVKATVQSIRRLLEEGKHIVIDDLRFPSEYEYLAQNLPVIFVRVKRPGFYPNPLLHKIRLFFHWVPILGTHLSEGQLNDHPVLTTLINDGDTPENLWSRVDALIYDWEKEIAPCIEDR